MLTVREHFAGTTLWKIDLLRYINDKMVIFFGVYPGTNYCRYRGRFSFHVLNELEAFMVCGGQ